MPSASAATLTNAASVSSVHSDDAGLALEVGVPVGVDGAGEHDEGTVSGSSGRSPFTAGRSAPRL